MNNSSWKNTVELAGIAAVVAGLIFVGLELRQSHEIARGSHYQDRSRFAFDYFIEMSEKEPFQKEQAERIRRFYDSGRWDVNDLNDRERQRLEHGTDEEVTLWYIRAEINLQLQQNFHYQYQLGLSEDQSWESQRVRLRGVLSSSIARQMILVDSNRWRESFVQVAREIIASRESNTD
ncbi:MAG: hypothetical protein GWN80_02175 [Gammaproteobacteria bacterium]|nr:hypothetical protein [Gammaproteobacteria bacterium]